MVDSINLFKVLWWKKKPKTASKREGVSWGKSVVFFLIFFSLQTSFYVVCGGFRRGPTSCKVPRYEERCGKFLTARGKLEIPISLFTRSSGFTLFSWGETLYILVVPVGGVVFFLTLV